MKKRNKEQIKGRKGKDGREEKKTFIEKQVRQIESNKTGEKN